MATMKKKTKELPLDLLVQVADRLRLLAHPHRLKMIELLESREDGASVSELCAWAELPHAACSQHLNQMKRVGLLTSSRRGREVFYAIADRDAVTILDCIRKKHDSGTLVCVTSPRRRT